MKILIERPPVYDACVAAFPGADVAHAIFSWGDRIYNPSDVPLTPALLAHEHVHCVRQQQYCGIGPGHTVPLELGVELWWQRYLSDAEFRLDEEALAHAAEYASLARGANRHGRRAALTMLAKRLASPLYGKLLSIDAAKARILAWGL